MLLTAMATLFGMYYQRGTLVGYGIPENLFPISLQDSLTLSHEAFISLVAQNIPSLFTDYKPLLMQAMVFAAGVSLMTALLVWVHLRGKASLYVGLRQRIKSHRATPWALSLSAGPLFGLVIYLAPRALIALASLIAFLPVLGYYVGQANTREFLKTSACDFQKPVSERNRCTKIQRFTHKERPSENDEFIQGLIVASNDRWIALLQGGTVLIIPANPDVIFVPVPPSQQ